MNLTPVGTGARMVASCTKVKAVSATLEEVRTVPSRKLQISALLALLSIAFLILRGIALDEKRHDERIKILERQLLEEFYLSKPGLAVTSEWLAFDLNVTASDGSGAVNSVGFNTHYLKAKSTAGSVYYSLFEKPSLLLLHGYGTTSSLSWRNVLPSLAEHYNIIAMDTPGFGRSSIDSDISGMSSGETLDMYCDFFSRFQEEVGLNSPYVVAHSFGGFLFTHCASRYPHLASNIMLADVPGFFPNNGGLDYTFAFYFSFGLPQSFIKLFMWGSFGEMALFKIARMAGLKWSDSMISYWHQFHMSPTLQSGAVVSKFVQFKYLYAGAENVALVPLMNMTTPMSLLYGENDPIAPIHQGHFVSGLAKGIHVSNLYIIPGIGHVPFLAKTKSQFIEMILDADITHKTGRSSVLATEVELTPKSTGANEAKHAGEVATCLHKRAVEWATYSCLPIAYFSELNRKSMYNVIQEIQDSC